MYPKTANNTAGGIDQEVDTKKNNKLEWLELKIRRNHSEAMYSEETREMSSRAIREQKTPQASYCNE